MRYFMTHEPRPAAADQTLLLERGDGEDYLQAAFDHLRGFLSESGGSPWAVSSPRQEACIREWADSLGLLLEAGTILNHLRKGGQEHDLVEPLRAGRIWKVTKNGYFGLTPGLELDLVPAGMDGRRFHLWESGIYFYLDRLLLQNALFGPINRLEGICAQGNEVSVVISQPCFDLLQVTQPEIDRFFLSGGFEKIAAAAYYRREDNIAVFDAHDKNVTSDGTNFVPFDVIPIRPDGGFLEFIERTLAGGDTLVAQRTTRTTEHASTSH